MPHAIAADGTRLQYEEFGRRDGEPMLMIQGLGADRRGWIRQKRSFSTRYRCISFDNRGVGGSDVPNGPYDLEVMADDALAVLDAVGVDRAHVMGASMGGVISQVLGVRHPERVRSLVLACTACHHHQWRRELLDEWKMIATHAGAGALLHTTARWLVGPRSLRRIWPALGALKPLAPIAVSSSTVGFVAQVDAILALDDALRFELRDVGVPTLVIVGSQDILTPLGDSEEIASLIPGAELAVVGGGAHGFMFEHASTFNRTVLDFLTRVDTQLEHDLIDESDLTSFA